MNARAAFFPLMRSSIGATPLAHLRDSYLVIPELPDLSDRLDA